MSRSQNPQKVHAFLKENPQRFYCDDCVEKGTGVDRHESNTITRTLALFPKEFRKMKITCFQRCSDREKECTAYISN